MKNYAKYLVLIIPLFFVFAIHVNGQESQARSFSSSLSSINKTRLGLGLKQISENQQLCSLAKLVATEQEHQYPKSILGVNDPKYKEYFKGFSKIGADGISTNDYLVKLQNLERKPFMDDKYLDLTFADKNSIVSMYPELTDGCVVASPGTVGYKQFGIFVGGVRLPEPIKAKPHNFLQSIKQFILNIFSGNKNQ
ncbi:MAG: hypothetical protein WCO78_00050 [Candidatus Roizmanbacteria bacterium]